MRRRDLLRCGLLTLAALAGGEALAAGPEGSSLPAFLREMAGRDSADGRVLVSLFLRGGLDGLDVASPFSDPHYRKARPTLALPPPSRSLDLGRGFGLNPRLAPLAPLYREGVLALLVAVGTEDTSRSHFRAQEYLEAGGGYAPQVPDGWLNRLVLRRPSPDGTVPAAACQRQVPRSLRGRADVLAAPGLSELAASRGSGTAAAYSRLAVSPALRQAGEAAVRFDKALRRLDPEGYRPAKGADYPATALGEQLKLLAFLIKSRVGLRVAHAELGDFDSHVEQEGPLYRPRLLPDLARSLAAFWRDLGPRAGEVTLVTLSEFGRRLKENGSQGTDHGTATCALVLGSGVAGGRVHGRWPGLAPEALRDGLDLEATTDYRDLLCEAARAAGCPQPETLFPGFRKGRPTGVFAGPRAAG